MSGGSGKPSAPGAIRSGPCAAPAIPSTRPSRPADRPPSEPCRRYPPVAASVRRLVGEPAVVLAVGQAVPVLVAAEMEMLRARIADRPFAHLVGQRQQRDVEA